MQNKTYTSSERRFGEQWKATTEMILDYGPVVRLDDESTVQE